MNFVDVQPKSFLDYAWTTPSAAPMSNAKPSKTSRKQNRCCDQCRKGKRACDAAILEDTLLDKTESSGVNPSVFHYSDVFGPLAPCSNCDKTKKQCTFEWLRTQRVSQATPQAIVTPPAKRRRKSNSSRTPQNRAEATQPLQTVAAPQSTAVPDSAPTAGGDLVPRNEPTGFAVTFADFPAGIPAFDLDIPTLSSSEPNGIRYNGAERQSCGGLGRLSDVLEDEEEMLFENDSGTVSSLGASSEGRIESPYAESPTVQSASSTVTSLSSHANEPTMRTPKKRRRRSSSSTSTSGMIVFPSVSTGNNLLLSTNNALLTEGLLRIYHDSFENALSCWLTERTCPYSRGSEVSLADDTGPDWNRIYHKVFRLDRLASSIRGRDLTFGENKAASRAINLAIFSFATQWAQSGERSKAKYPFHSDGSDERGRVFSGNVEISSACKEFDRALQRSAWHEARMALQDAAEIESFRVVLAQIVFSLTQKPTDLEEEKPRRDDSANRSSNTVNAEPARPYDESVRAEPCQPDDNISECEDLLSRLNLTIDGDGPPIHLEQGLRLIHSLRSRLAMTGSLSKASSRCAKQKLSANQLTAGDRTTVDLLFWMGIMFDTLSSAMHRRPLVVSDEDSDIYSNEPRPAGSPEEDSSASAETLGTGAMSTGGLWDEYLFARQRKRSQGNPVRWPCSYDLAASLLCDAAPVKVLLFRKVTRIQTLLTRNIHGDKVERAIKEALDVYDHWQKLYASFIRDLIKNHDELPPRLQSWYICVAGHWHLATLLLADLMEIVDGSGLGTAQRQQQRTLTHFIDTFREHNCYALSDVARCACPHENASFPKSHDFHFAVNQGALLTEPWTAVLIRAFAKAGVVLLETESSGEAAPSSLYQEDAFRRADDCVRALWYLGRKSDMALAAAKILGNALKERRKGAEEKVNEMSTFLEAELWQGFDEMGGAFGVECA